MNEAELAREQAEAYLLEKLRIYQGLLDSTLKKAIDAIPVAEELLIPALKLANELAKDHPVLRKYRPDSVGLYELVNHDLYPNHITAMRERWAKLPLRLQGWVDKIRSAGPGWFRSYHPETFARDDIGAGESLVSELRAIRDFSKNVASVLSEIKIWHENHPDYKADETDDVAITPRPLPPDHGDPNEPPARWDSRDPRTFGK